MAATILLKDLCTIDITDGTHKTPTYADEGYIFLSSKNVTSGIIDWDNVMYIPESLHDELYKRIAPQRNDILLAKNGTTGVAAIVDRDEVFDIYVSLALIRPDASKVLPRYLLHAINSHPTKKFFDSHLKGIGVPNLHLTHIREAPIKVPSLAEQQEITGVLDKIDGLIAMRKEQLVKLDEFVKARFVELFGDVIQNDRGWEQNTFSDIATSRLGKMLDAKQQTGKYAYPYLANFNVQWFRFEIDNLNKMDFNEADRQEFELRDGDLLVCEGGEIGRCAVWHNEIQPCFFQKALHRVRCNRHVILPDYMAWWFKYNCDHKGFSAIEGAKATIAHLPGAKLKALKVTVPPIELQNQFATFVEQTDKSKLSIQQGLDKLEILKKSLMQKFFG